MASYSLMHRAILIRYDGYFFFFKHSKTIKNKFFYNFDCLVNIFYKLFCLSYFIIVRRIKD